MLSLSLISNHVNPQCAYRVGQLLFRFFFRPFSGGRSALILYSLSMLRLIKAPISIREAPIFNIRRFILDANINESSILLGSLQSRS